MKLIHIAIFFIAGFAGFCLGVTIWDGFLSIFTPSVVGMWIFVAIITLVTAFCVCFREQEVIIVATAYGGSWMIMRSIGIVAPGWSLTGGQSAWIWFYIVMNAVLTVVGIFVQWKLKQRDENNQHPYQQIRKSRR